MGEQIARIRHKNEEELARKQGGGERLVVINSRNSRC